MTPTTSSNSSASHVLNIGRALALVTCAALAPACSLSDRDMGDEPMDKADAAQSRDSGPEPEKRDAGGDAAVPGVDAGGYDAGDWDAAPSPQVTFGGLTTTVAPEEQGLDLFGVAGHRIWLEVAPEQLQVINSGQGGNYDGDIYTPTPVVSGGYADHALVEDFATGSVADYGKVEVKLVGESTRRQWDANHIPNVHVDTDEFQPGMRIGGFEHFRLNNSLIGSIFREQLAHRIFHELGYPSLRASYAFLGSNVWGSGVWVPMTSIEVYKHKFCKDNKDLLGGSCVNMWEFPGQIGNGGGWGGGGGGGPIIDLGGFFGGGDDDGGVVFPDYDAGIGGGELPENACQVKTCNDKRLLQLIAKVNATPAGPGFRDALAPYLDWKMFHRFQCLNWMLWIGDDPLHNSNNNLIIERDDHKIVWAPYSVDISMGQDWYTFTPLTGSSAIARGCQQEPACWADTIKECSALIDDFNDLKPEKMLDAAYTLLDKRKMLRDGDTERAQQIREWLTQRRRDLPAELETYRYLPDSNGDCSKGLERCGDGGCGTPEDCETRKCDSSSYFCESRQQCVWSPVDCPSCPKQLPYFCTESYNCVASHDQCPCDCRSRYPTTEYCYATHSCVQPGDCSDEDGGVPNMMSGDGGVPDGGAAFNCGGGGYDGGFGVAGIGGGFADGGWLK